MDSNQNGIDIFTRPAYIIFKKLNYDNNKTRKINKKKCT